MLEHIRFFGTKCDDDVMRWWRHQIITSLPVWFKMDIHIENQRFCIFTRLVYIYKERERDLCQESKLLYSIWTQIIWTNQSKTKYRSDSQKPPSQQSFPHLSSHRFIAWLFYSPACVNKVVQTRELWFRFMLYLYRLFLQHLNKNVQTHRLIKHFTLTAYEHKYKSFCQKMLNGMIFLN